MHAPTGRGAGGTLHTDTARIHLMFRLTLFIIVTLLQSLFFIRARRWARARFPGQKGVPNAIAVLFATFTVGLVIALFLGPVVPHLPGWMLAVLARPFYIWEGATILVGLALLAALVVAAPVHAAVFLLRHFGPPARAFRRLAKRPAAVKFDAARRAFLLHSFEGITAASFGAATYGVFAGRTGFEFTDTEMAIRGLPAALDRFTIALVSDVHSSSFMTKAQMDGYCRALMSLGTDLITVPGDFVNSQTEEVYPFAESFSALHAPCGVYGVMGNHDFYAPDPERVAREVDACGVKLLRNDRVIIEKNGARLALIGIDDVGRPERAAFSMEQAVRGVPRVLPRILLCHRPYFLNEAASLGMDLVLSGHTHGGQIVLGRFGPVVLTPAAIASPYIWGKYSRGRTQMYVSRGIGTVGLPMRINCPPEITRITLRRSAPGARAAQN
jgi:predicted MPP superfamily phosphohydrolase